MIRSFSTFYRPDSIVAESIAKELSKRLEALGYEYKKPEEADVTFVIGGDGTFLHAAPRARLVFPIKLGRVGFFYEIEATEYRRYVERFLSGDFMIEEIKRISLAGTDCVNEHYITSKNSGKVISAAIYVDGELFRRGLADGVMVSTPLASTAYSLSVGGPLLDPNVEAAIVNIVSPVGGRIPSLVVGNPARVEIEIYPTRRGQKLVSDGIDKLEFNELKRFFPKRGRPLRIIRFGDTGLRRMLKARSKLIKNL